MQCERIVFDFYTKFEQLLYSNVQVVNSIAKGFLFEIL